jgi:class 3 adenylate cyclase/alpha-beta hydrolase superfamily lysophospholipase
VASLRLIADNPGMEPEIRYTTTADGVSIAYYTMGEGQPLLVTSNVLWSHLRFQPFREYDRSRSGNGLGRGLQVVRYDARGTGLSDRHALDFSMEARLLDLEAVVERLKLTRFAIFGLGHGTPAAIAYAADHPERVSHLVLANTYARGRDHRESVRVFDSMRERADEQWALYTLTLATSNLGFSDSESARKLASLYRESMTPESVRAFWAAQEAIDVTELLARVAVPTLVMYRPGSGGTLEWSRQVASKIPDARFVTVTRRGDLAWTGEETRIVEDFLGVNPEPPARPRPDALAERGRKASASRTIVYTDIEGNTDMLQRLGDDAWRAVLRDHERITRELLQAHGGTEVKTMGDGFMASFDSATSAVECAIDLQRSFAARNDTAAEPMLVRVGLNAGEPIEEDDDLFGTAVTMAARIMAQGAGGEILVSDLVRGLVAGKGFTFADRGEFAMKGFDDAVRLYEVRWREGN